MQGSFGGETFTFSLFLVLCNRLTTMTVAFTMLLVRKHAMQAPIQRVPACVAKLPRRILWHRWSRGALCMYSQRASRPPCHCRRPSVLIAAEARRPGYLPGRRRWLSPSPSLCLQLYGQDMRPVAPPYNYAAVSVSNVVATFCQYEALKHVSFPMQARALLLPLAAAHAATQRNHAPANPQTLWPPALAAHCRRGGTPWAQARKVTRRPSAAPSL